MFIINIFYRIGLIIGHLTGIFYKNFFSKNYWQIKRGMLYYNCQGER